MKVALIRAKAGRTGMQAAAAYLSRVARCTCGGARRALRRQPARDCRPGRATHHARAARRTRLRHAPARSRNTSIDVLSRDVSPGTHRRGGRGGGPARCVTHLSRGVLRARLPEMYGPPRERPPALASRGVMLMPFGSIYG